MTMSKYNLGDRVIVVHRLDDNGYFSYKLDGSIGTVIAVEHDLINNCYIYKLDHEEINSENCDCGADEVFKLASDAWYQECCLDPAPVGGEVNDEDFEEVLK